MIPNNITIDFEMSDNFIFVGSEKAQNKLKYAEYFNQS